MYAITVTRLLTYFDEQRVEKKTRSDTLVIRIGSATMAHTSIQ